VAAVLALVVLAAPVEDADLRTASYYSDTLESLRRSLDSRGAPPQPEALEGGSARVEIVPPEEWRVPMAGNRRLAFTRAEGRRPESVWARALALSQGDRRLLLVSADILVIAPALAMRVEERLGLRIGLGPGEILLVAAHTHSGPGGYWSGRLAEQSVGPFDARVLDYLVDRLSEVAVEAWAARKPVAAFFSSVELDEPIRNRAGRLELENARLGLLRFVALDGSFTVDLVNYSAHPVSLLRGGPRLSGDYPALMAARIDDRQRTLIFTPGTIGDMKPVWDGVREPDRKSRAIADHLVDAGVLRMEPSRLAPAVLESFEIEVTLPPVQARLFRSDLLGSWALREWLARRLLPGGLDRATVQVVRIGPVALLGAPADLASSVALPLLERARRLGMEVLFVSMADGWIGYVMEEAEYRDSDYKEASQLHGPQSGPLFTAVYTGVIDWLASRSRGAGGEASGRAEGDPASGSGSAQQSSSSGSAGA
jgi:hypothetical protein